MFAALKKLWRRSDVYDVTKLEGDGFREYAVSPPKLEVLEVEAKAVSLSVGSLNVIGGSIGKGASQIGYGTRVYLDGKEVEKVKSLEITFKPDEIVTARFEVYA